MAFAKKLIGEQEVGPGPVEPGQLPEPTEITCIEVTKIYDSCSQRLCLDSIPPVIFVPTITNPTFGRCENVTVTLVSPPGFTLTPIPERPGFVRVQATFQVTYDVVITNTSGDIQTLTGLTTTFNKDIVLYVPEPTTAIMKYEAVAECLFGRVNVGTPTTLEVIIGVWIIIKSAMDVQLLIPSYGFCPVPPECEEFPTNVCDEFMQRPFPPIFPPQKAPYSPY
ncbi:MAG: hypothetical protein PWR08_1866 [Thermoanaerobacterium sp.]|jgi:hypothetical protein|nr:hypothetical protein [Thermoanaerobacterium sp.]